MKSRIAVIAAAIAILASCSTSEPDPDATELNWESAADFVGETATICGPVAGVNVEPGEPIIERVGDGLEMQGWEAGDTFVNIGKDYPDPSRFAVVVFDEEPSDYDWLTLEEDVCATGFVKMYKGSPQMILNSVSDLEAVNVVDPEAEYRKEQQDDYEDSRNP